jgi:hypothetical protein
MGILEAMMEGVRLSRVHCQNAFPEASSGAVANEAIPIAPIIS